MIELNLDQAIDDISRFKTKVTGANFERAVKLGLNEGIRRARTDMVREIISHFNDSAFTPSGVRRALSIENASEGHLTSKLLVSGKPIPLQYFSARQVQSGISVEVVKGRRKVIQSAFFFKRGSNRLAMARGEYDQNVFNFRHKRVNKDGQDLPISKLLSISVPSAIHSPDVPVLKTVGQKAEDYTLTRILHALERMTNDAIR